MNKKGDRYRSEAESVPVPMRRRAGVGALWLCQGVPCCSKGKRWGFGK